MPVTPGHGTSSPCSRTLSISLELTSWIVSSMGSGDQPNRCVRAQEVQPWSPF